MAKNENLTEGLGDKVEEFSEKMELKVREVENRRKKSSKMRGPFARRPIAE